MLPLFLLLLLLIFLLETLDGAQQRLKSQKVVIIPFLPTLSQSLDQAPITMH